MKSAPTTITAVFLLLLLVPAVTFAWRYTLYQGNELIYDGPIPPQDLTYPLAGQPTPEVDDQDPLEGRVLSQREKHALPGRRHLIIVPSSTTGGLRALDDR